MKYHEHEYAELRGLIATMSEEVCKMIEGSTKALVERDSQLARQIIDQDAVVDQLDIDIDKACVRMIALYEPKAIDLRFVMTASRLIVDLERMGDHCVDICREVLKLNDVPQMKPYIDIPKMAEHTIKMVRDSIDAFFNKDIEMALEIIDRDDFIDDLYHQVLRELLTYIFDDVRNTKTAVWLTFIIRSIERIADHATNICEMLYFMQTGEIIRHKFLREELSNEPNSAD